jgi:endonuclease I
MGKKILITFLLTLTLITMVGCIDEPANTSTNEITSDQPTTNLPTTEAPTTDVPTTEEPTTEVPTTEVPTTEEPTTEVPTTETPTTEEPTTELPTTEAPTTEAPTTSNPIDELFFSEYGEGSGSNKYVEIFNGTGQVVDLSGYEIEYYTNGSTSVSGSISLTGSIDAYDVFVVANSGAVQEILDEADLTSGSLQHNGDDVLTLVKNGNIIDIIGDIGTSSAYAANVTLVRNDNILSGSLSYEQTEWASYPSDTFEYIGFHSDYSPTDIILFQQDKDQLPNTIELYGYYDLGEGNNGSTYTILDVSGDASNYIILDDSENDLVSSLTLDEVHTGTIDIEVNYFEQYIETVTVSVEVKMYVYDTSTMPEYYSSIGSELSGTALIDALNILLNTNFTGYSYSAANEFLAVTDADPNNPDNIITVYSRTSVDGEWDGGVTWNKEHVWPQSLLDEDAGNSINSASDLHNLKPAVPSENSSRGNKYYDNITTNDTYEPHDDVKGDVARILFYMMVMYDELNLVDQAPGTHEMGLLSVLIQWHEMDPVDDFELNRNNVIYDYQGNRNPFIDNPEWVDLIWGDTTN